MTAPPTSILFLCVANAARSQMAEGLARALLPPAVAVFSAGSAPTAVHPLAVAVMAERGIDLSTHRSKRIDEVPAERIDLAVTLCAEEVCPVVPGAVERLAWPHEDPAAAAGDEEARRAAFRRVRDGIEARVRAELLGRWPTSP